MPIETVDGHVDQQAVELNSELVDPLVVAFHKQPSRHLSWSGHDTASIRTPPGATVWQPRPERHCIYEGPRDRPDSSPIQAQEGWTHRLYGTL